MGCLRNLIKDTVKCLAQYHYKQVHINSGGLFTIGMCSRGIRLFCSKCIVRRTMTTLPDNLKPTTLISRLIAYIDDVSGATEISEAHAKLKQNEKKLQDAQALRRKKRDELDTLQTRLKHIHSELDRFSRGDDKYLRLLTEEHSIIKCEQALLNDVKRADEAEKVAFDELSSTLRASHAKEREQSGRIKTWTVIASTLGALFGIIGSWVANEVRMRKIRELVPDTVSLTALIKDLVAQVEMQQSEVATFISEIRQAMHLNAVEEVATVASNKNIMDEVPSSKLVNLLQEQNKVLAGELNEIKRLIAIELNSKAETPNVVYIGGEMEELLNKSEKSIESKMKLQTLVEVVFLYALITVSIPLIYALLKSP